MDRQLFLASKKIMLTVVLLLAISYVQAQETKEPLTLTLDKALEIALSDNPTIKVAEEEIALKKVANKETWQSLLPVNPEKPDVPLNKNDAFQKVQKRRVQEKR